MKYSSKELVRIAICSALTGILAWIKVPLPFTPVPISAQTFGVMISGLVLPPPLAALSQLIYILLGLLGLPVFSGGQSGLGTLAGPTGGYIIGFIPAAFVISFLIKKYNPKTFWSHSLILTLGSIVIIYFTGVLQLILVTGISPMQALISGVFSFLIGDFLKVIIGARLAKRISNFN